MKAPQRERGGRWFLGGEEADRSGRSKKKEWAKEARERVTGKKSGRCKRSWKRSQGIFVAQIQLGVLKGQ